MSIIRLVPLIIGIVALELLDLALFWRGAKR